MKRFIAGAAILALIATSAFAAPFAPSVMKIIAPSTVQYDFDGKNVSIPVTVTGAPASASFLVFTKGKAASISNVVNGYLGWHMVNKIDTCVYVSPFTALDKGSNTIVWNGKDKDGAQVPSGEYTYYIFGFDNVTPRVHVTQSMRIDAWQYRTTITHDPSGAPLNNPIIYRSSGGGKGDAVGNLTQSKWVVGGDPDDATLLETTQDSGYLDRSGLAFQGEGTNPNKYYFHEFMKVGEKVITKWEWVPNGVAVLQSDWGDNGQFSFTGNWTAGWSFGPGVANDGKGNLFAVNADISGLGTESQLIYVDINDGTEIKRFDLSPWWVDAQEGGEAGGQYGGGPIDMELKNDHLFFNSHSSCTNQMINPYADSDENVVLWTNANGDYTGDHNYEPDSKHPWMCNDYNVGPFKYTIAADANDFSFFSAYGMGAVSFGLFAPDGYSMGYQALAGETSRQKMGVECIDYGSAYDGIYTTNNTTGGDKGVYDIDYTTWWVAHDSIKGTISSQVGVKSDAPSAFAVAQNSPNPFNPTTTISFTLAKAGKTTVDVYNVAGQKVATLANGTLSAGSHSVVWNAANASAGVYFYTVKSGSFSKTMKMTLLK